MDQDIYERSYAHEHSHWWFSGRREILEAVVRARLAAGSSILDIGCGSGYFLEAIRHGFDAWGIDPSPLAVNACRRRGNPNALEGSAFDLSRLNGRRFDAACFFDVLEHLEDDAGALRSARDALAVGGLVFITVPAFMFLWSSRDVSHQHFRRYTRRGLRALVERAGFDLVRLTFFNFYLFPLAAAARLAGRVLRRDTSSDLKLPPGPVNRAFRRIFAAEARTIAPANGQSFPVGLSLLAVGRRRAP